MDEWLRRRVGVFRRTCINIGPTAALSQDPRGGEWVLVGCIDSLFHFIKSDQHTTNLLFHRSSSIVV